MIRNLLLLFVLAPAAHAAPPEFSCVANNILLPSGHDDWHVKCQVKVNDKVIWDRYLPAPEPQTFKEAMRAIERFKKDELPRIVKKYEEVK